MRSAKCNNVPLDKDKKRMGAMSMNYSRSFIEIKSGHFCSDNDVRKLYIKSRSEGWRHFLSIHESFTTHLGSNKKSPCVLSYYHPKIDIQNPMDSLAH